MELIIISYTTDLVFGDPEWFIHPVRLIGRLINTLDRILNNNRHRIILLCYGIITALSVVSLSGICAYFIIQTADKLNPLAGKIAWVFLAYTTIAMKDLVRHARAVREKLIQDDLKGARDKLSLIVGRDTDNLAKDDIVRATIETTAESLNDGVIAPLFYLFLGGPIAAVCFKAVSTLDSMIGHKNQRYIYFGWCAAKLDSLANFIPARITGLLICTASLFCKKNFRQPLKIMFRDGRKQDSLNSAISESAMAGALGIRLCGPCSYQSKIANHAYLGEEKNPVTLNLINEAILISITASLIMVITGTLIKNFIR